MILSPQWFTEAHLSSEAYSSRFSERMYAAFLKNKKISKTLKTDITNRVKSLLAEDTEQLERVGKYEDIYLKHSLNPISCIEMKVYDAFMNYKQRFLYCKNLEENVESIAKNQSAVQNALQRILILKNCCKRQNRLENKLVQIMSLFIISFSELIFLYSQEATRQADMFARIFGNYAGS